MFNKLFLSLQVNTTFHSTLNTMIKHCSEVFGLVTGEAWDLTIHCIEVQYHLEGFFHSDRCPQLVLTGREGLLTLKRCIKNMIYLCVSLKSCARVAN